MPDISKQPSTRFWLSESPCTAQTEITFVVEISTVFLFFFSFFLAFYFAYIPALETSVLNSGKKIPVFSVSRTHRNDLFGTYADENSLILYNSRSSEKNKTITKF